MASCAGDPKNPFQDIGEIQVIVRHTQGFADGEGEESFNSRFGYDHNRAVGVVDVPEGPDEEITVLGWSGGGTPSWFARRKHMLIEAGRDNPLDVVLSRFGGYSCPAADGAYTHRLFPSVTPLGGGLFFIAGGLTTAATPGTRFVTSDSSRKAFMYNSTTGTLKSVSSSMKVGRGAHSAVLVKGADKNRVVLFGSTSAMTFNAENANGFAWSFDTKDAHSTIEVYEYSAGGDATQGEFLEAASALQMFKKRVFPTANVVSNDGLVLVCGGGPWGVQEQPDGYDECDVYDAPITQFLGDQVANSFMANYRTGASAVSFQEGEITKLLFVGGVVTGNPVAEVYTSSTAQRDGVGGSFVATDIPGPPHSYFQSLTPLGTGEFALIGGVNWNGSNFEAPSEQNVWFLHVTEVEGGHKVEARQGPGLGVGRYFHAAASPAGNRLVVVGGFTGNSLTPTSDVRFLETQPIAPDANVLDRYVGLITPPETELPYSARGGMGQTLLDNDTVLLVGGISGVADLQTDQFGAIEVYTPSNLLPQ